MSQTMLEKIILTARIGSDLYKCVGEAISKCSDEVIDVDLIHNNKIYKIRRSRVSDLIGEIMEEGDGEC